MSANLAWVLALVLGPAMASAQCYEDTHCFYTCGYGYYQHAGLWHTQCPSGTLLVPFRGH